MRLAACLAISMVFGVRCSAFGVRTQHRAPNTEHRDLRIQQPAPHPLSPKSLSHEIARRAFIFFRDETDPHTGLTKDRARLNGGDSYTVASIAATGYALTALPIGVENGWMARGKARRRALVTLRFLGERMPQVHGWYYHFVDMRTGARVWKCELSSIDTALLLAGVIAVGQYWPGTEVSKRADALLARVDWTWMLTDGGATPAELTLCMGWKPESGFLKSRWSAYCEHMLLYILGLGAPYHPLPAASWSAWSRPIEKNEGYDVIAPGPIFMHQMTQGYLDLRGRRDCLGYDYWQNSINAHLANALFCARFEEECASYRGGVWGLNASDIPDGYGTRAPQENESDGTVCPTGAVAGLPFVPELSTDAFTQIYERYGSRIWGRYGFADAFNADFDWWDPDVIGIDLGMALVAIEDARSGFVWRLMSHSPIIRRGLRAAGFHRTFETAPRPVLLASHAGTGLRRRPAIEITVCTHHPLHGYPSRVARRGASWSSMSPTEPAATLSCLSRVRSFCGRVPLARRPRRPYEDGGIDEEAFIDIASDRAGAWRRPDGRGRDLVGGNRPASGGGAEPREPVRGAAGSLQRLARQP